jgi:lipid II:glycine glycyltransferase (peptidoglycan interpeptide bridge formation enzyme)
VSNDPDEVWRQIKRRARQLTNKAKKAHVRVEIKPNSLDDFYPVYSRAMREVGTPTFGERFFRAVEDCFPENFRLATVRHRHDLLGSASIAPFKDTLYCLWGGMLRQFYDLRPNHLLYWETLKFACDNGLEWVDLGRSQWDSGTYAFKKNWGAEPRPLYQKIFLNGISRPPAVGGSMKAETKYRLFFDVWRRLPLSATEALGPWLRKRMPFG